MSSTYYDYCMDSGVDYLYDKAIGDYYDDDYEKPKDLVKIENIRNLIKYLDNHDDINADNHNEIYDELYELTTDEYQEYLKKISSIVSHTPLTYILDHLNNYNYSNNYNSSNFYEVMLKYILKCDIITEKDLTMKVNPIIYLFQHNNSDVFFNNYKYFIKYSEKYFSDERYDDNNMNALSYILQYYSNIFYKQNYDDSNYQKEYIEYYYDTFKSIIDLYCKIKPNILNKLDKNNKYPIDYCLNNMYIADYIIKKDFI